MSYLDLVYRVALKISHLAYNYKGKVDESLVCNLVPIFQNINRIMYRSSIIFVDLSLSNGAFLA